MYSCHGEKDHWMDFRCKMNRAADEGMAIGTRCVGGGEMKVRRLPWSPDVG